MRCSTSSSVFLLPNRALMSRNPNQMMNIPRISNANFTKVDNAKLLTKVSQMTNPPIKTK